MTRHHSLLRSIAALAGLALLGSACALVEPDPGQVVRDFHEAVGAGEVERALGHLALPPMETSATERTAATMNGEDAAAAMLQAFSSVAASGDVRHALRQFFHSKAVEVSQHGGIDEIEIVDEQVIGEMARVTFTITLGDRTTEGTETVQLVKVNGDWKIQL